MLNKELLQMPLNANMQLKIHFLNGLLFMYFIEIEILGKSQKSRQCPGKKIVDCPFMIES